MKESDPKKFNMDVLKSTDVIVYDIIQITKEEFNRFNSKEKFRELLKNKSDLAIKSIMNRVSNAGLLKEVME